MNTGTSSYLIGFMATMALNVWLYWQPPAAGYGQRLRVPVGILSLWCGLLAWQSAQPVFPPILLVLTDLLRNGSWLWFFGRLLNPGRIPATFLWVWAGLAIYPGPGKT